MAIYYGQMTDGDGRMLPIVVDLEVGHDIVPDVVIEQVWDALRASLRASWRFSYTLPIVEPSAPIVEGTCTEVIDDPTRLLAE